MSPLGHGLEFEPLSGKRVARIERSPRARHQITAARRQPGHTKRSWARQNVGKSLRRLAPRLAQLVCLLGRRAVVAHRVAERHGDMKEAVGRDCEKSRKPRGHALGSGTRELHAAVPIRDSRRERSSLAGEWPMSLVRDDAEFRVDGVEIHEWTPERARFSVRRDTAGARNLAILAAVTAVGSTLLLGGIAVAAFRQSGVGGLLCPGLLWLVAIAFPGWLSRQMLRQLALTELSITPESVSIMRRLPWGLESESHPAESDMDVEWYIEYSSGEADSEPTWHMELAGAGWRIPFGHALTEAAQRELVGRLREHVGQTLRNTCPECGEPLRSSGVDPATGRQDCGNCGWLSRGRHAPLVQTAQGHLVLPAIRRGLMEVELATPEVLILKIGTSLSSWLVLLGMLIGVGLFLMCLITGVLLQFQNNPGQAVDVIAGTWLGAIVLGVLFVVVLYWHRHYRQTVTLTATHGRREIEVERIIGGLPLRQWVSLEQGGYISAQQPLPAVVTLPQGRIVAQSDIRADIYLVGAGGKPRIGVGQRLSRDERRWLRVVLNRFFGTPALCRPGGERYPDTCPQCGRPLAPSDVDTQSGAIHCDLFPRCGWNSALDAHPELQEVVAAGRQQWTTLRERWRRWWPTAWQR